MKNVRYQPGNPTETRTIIARTQIAKPNSELGSNDSTGYRIPKLPQARASSHAPPQRIPRVDEVESSEPRKRGSMAKEGSAESFFLVLWCAARQQ